jgi:ketosteroid isomerase-like protein
LSIAINRGTEMPLSNGPRVVRARRHIEACAMWALLALESAAIAGQAPEAPQSQAAERLAASVRQVEATERDFARAMADRNLDGFASLVAEDAVFRSESGLLIGRSAVVDGWRSLFGPGPAPFSWDPDTVTVAQSGDTALSSGPVFDRNGKRIARFTSIWRRQLAPDGRSQWRIIVDQGVPVDACQ